MRAPITDHNAFIVDGKGQKRQRHERQAPQLEQEQCPALHSQPDVLTMPQPTSDHGCDQRPLKTKATSQPGHKLGSCNGMHIGHVVVTLSPTHLKQHQ